MARLMIGYLLMQRNTQARPGIRDFPNFPCAYNYLYW
jgi:hypothetical protein